MIEEIEYGSRTIRFSVESRERKTLGISVLPDCSVEVAAPKDRTREEIITAVRRRARWIVRQQERFAAFDRRDNGKEYVSGETHRYLGRQYLLKVIEAESRDAERVKLMGGQIQVFTISPQDGQQVRTLLDLWYRDRAKLKFSQRLDICYDVMRKYGIERPMMMLRTMPRRWGSCTKRGAILLNPLLIHAPTPCIDYVIMHELCHLKVMRHDREFLELLGRVMPDWGERKGRLEGCGG